MIASAKNSGLTSRSPFFCSGQKFQRDTLETVAFARWLGAVVKDVIDENS